MALFYRYSAVFNQWLLWHQPLETEVDVPQSQNQPLETEVDVPQSQNQPLETEIGTRSGYFTFWIRSTNTAAHTAMTMEMANAGV